MDERACWLHALALYRAGRAPEALSALRTHARRLDDDLGLDPGPALRDLEGAMLRQEAELDLWPAASASDVPGVVEPDRPAPSGPAGPADPGGAGGPEPGPRRRLVGRDRELAALDAVLVPGATGWVVLEGAAGMGKSRLAQECVDRWAARGGEVVRSGCPDDESIPAWWPMRQVLRDLGMDPDAVLVPPSGTDIDAARYATYERVRDLLLRAADRRPLLLFLDDVHWADATSLGFLTLLAESRPVPGLVVLLTTRPVTGAPAVARLLVAAARATGGAHVGVPPLARAEVAALAHQVSDGAVDAAEAATLAERTGGNPFFVTEYARLPPEVRHGGGVPGAIRSVLEQRLDGVDPEVLQVLRTAAVIGHALDVDLLERVTRMSRDDLADLLDDAADEHIIVAGASGGYEFVHALMREHVADGLAGLRRQRLHLRVAAELAGRPGSDALVRRAAHLVAALPLGDPAETVAACRAAALDAESRWQSDDAASWWGSAIAAVDLLPDDQQGGRDELVAAQVFALARAGRGETAVTVVDAALEAAMRAGRLAATGPIAGSLLRSAGAWPWAVYPGEDPVGEALRRRLFALERLVRDDPASHVRVLATLATGSVYDPDGRVPDRLSATALAEAEALGDPDVLADALLGRALAFSGIAERAQESVVLLERLAALPHTLHRLDAVLCDNLGTLALMSLGRIREASERVRSGIVGSELLRLPVSRAQLRWISAELTQWRGGDLDQAEVELRRGFALHRETELYQSGVRELSVLALAWDRGVIADVDLEVHQPALRWITVLIAAARDEPGARDALRAEAEREEPPIWTTHGRLTLIAHVACDLGMADLAEPLLRRLEPLGGLVANLGQVGNLGPIALALTRLAILAGDHERARAHLAVATAIATEGEASRHLLRCRVLAARLDGAHGSDGADDADDARARRSRRPRRTDGHSASMTE